MLIELAFTDRNHAAPQPAVDSIDIFEQAINGQRHLGKIN